MNAFQTHMSSRGDFQRWLDPEGPVFLGRLIVINPKTNMLLDAGSSKEWLTGDVT